MKSIKCDVCGCEIEKPLEMFTLSMDYVKQRENIFKAYMCRDCAKRLYDMVLSEAKGADE